MSIDKCEEIIMKKNQKKLYENFKKEAEIHKDPLIRERCKKAAAEILKSFSDFEKKAEEIPEKPETKKERATRLKAEAANKEV